MAMTPLPGYEITVKLYESYGSLIFRARRLADGQAVVLKVLKKEFPKSEELARFRREYEITRAFQSESIIRALDLEKHQRTMAMVLEDFGGDSIANHLKHQRLAVLDFLGLAIRITKILGQVHQKHIIHKDINPGNILWNAQTDQVKLIDFGISSELAQEKQSVLHPNVLEGTLPYISPEQTGRMNRMLDYRTDLYSLGVTFYEMLTGELPLHADNAMEWVHAHIAKEPIPLRERLPNLSPVLASIISKMMAKTAEERYQSSFGLKADLERCLVQLQSAGVINDFEIGQQDLSDHFQISQKLYGREEEVDMLVDAFDRVSSGPSELVLVSGYSGVGKSALVHEIHKPVIRRRGHFIVGSFDSHKRSMPYAPFLEAFQILIRQLLAESEEQVDRWKIQLREKLGSDGAVLIQAIPELEMLVGNPPEWDELTFDEAGPQLQRAIRQLVSIFATQEHPLCIFLDNLQSADLTSLELIEALMRDPEGQHLLLVGAYRDNEVDSVHPLMLVIERIQNAKARLETVLLDSLGLIHVTELIVDTLKCDAEMLHGLPEFCFDKTYGNPFFLNQILQSLYDQELLRFNSQRGLWDWDIEEIQNLQTTDNVVELMAAKIQKLPEATQQALKLAACIGNHFDVSLLSILNNRSPSETADDLWEALLEGLLWPTDDSYKLLPHSDDGEAGASYKFLHERVQQAAYSLMDTEHKTKAHWSIGQFILENTSEDQRTENLFAIVRHLNHGRMCIETKEQRHEIALLNLTAGKKAKAMGMYSEAFAYLTVGMEVLDQNGWKVHYALMLELTTGAAEAAFMNVDLAAMQYWTGVIVEQSRCLMDRIKAHELQIKGAQAQNRLKEAIRLGISVLHQLNIDFPESPNSKHVKQAYRAVERALAEYSTEKLYDLPSMTDPDARAKMVLLASIAPATYYASQELTPLLVFHMVQLSVRHGNSPESALGYTFYGMWLAGKTRDIDRGYQYGQLGLKLAEQNGKIWQTRTEFIFYSFLHPWKVSLLTVLPELMQVYQKGLSNGALEYAAKAIQMYSCYSLTASKDLNEVEREIASHHAVLRRLRQEPAILCHLIDRQMIENLIESQENPSWLIGTHFNEKQALPQMLRTKNRNVLFHLYNSKLLLGYLFGEHKHAYETALHAGNYQDNAVGGFQIAQFRFYDSLAKLALWEQSSASQRAGLSQQIRVNQKWLKHWTDFAAINHRHKWMLVQAEYCKALGKGMEAMEYYDQAIEQAHEAEDLLIEALTNERAALIWDARNKDEFASYYMQKAHHCYQLWGSSAKVKDLERRYRHLIFRASQKSEKKAGSTLTSSFGGDSDQFLDLNTVLKAAQSISGEIMLPELLKKLMSIVIENAGAQKGLLLLEKRGQWVIEAEGSIETEAPLVLQSIPIDTAPEQGKLPVPRSIIHYVSRTRESVVLAHASEEGHFLQDEYVIQYEPKSILCMPLLNQGQLTGILYLENNLTTGAFTKDRLDVLNLLSAQIAVSIENAHFYTKMSRLNATFEQFVPKQFLRRIASEDWETIELGRGENAFLTILFSDIRGFTELSEQMSPQEVLNFLNSYLQRMNTPIHTHHGFVDKFIGDAIMALFESQYGSPNEAARNAVNAAVGMQEAVKVYNRHRANCGYAPVSIGIGIHSGPVIVGTIGSEDRMDSTVLGDAVNLASRLEGLTKQYQSRIIVSSQTFRLLEDDTDLLWRELDYVAVKGKQKPVSIFEIFSTDPPPQLEGKQAIRQPYHEGLMYYYCREWGQAIRLFEECLQRFPADPVSKVFLNRCRNYQANPPGEDWNGALKLMEK